MNTKPCRTTLPIAAFVSGRGLRSWLRPSFLAAALVALPLATEPLSAQVVLAARAGMSLATLAYSSDPGVDIGYRRGVSVGLSATYYPAEKVGITACRGAWRQGPGRTSAAPWSKDSTRRSGRRTSRATLAKPFTWGGCPFVATPLRWSSPGTSAC